MRPLDACGVVRRAELGPPRATPWASSRPMVAWRWPERVALHWTTAALLVASAGASLAAGAPDVDALVTYETRQVTSAGVTRTERWQERLVRRGDSVWSERVLTASTAVLHTNETATEHAGHKHFDFDRAARLVQRDAKGQLRLRFVDREKRVAVDVPAAEYGAVGFDGSWDAAAHLVPPSVVARMGAAAVSGWRSEKVKGWSHRVRWSSALQLPMRLESQRDDGNVRRVVTVEVRAPVVALPWAALGGYTQKDYDDFMD